MNKEESIKSENEKFTITIGYEFLPVYTLRLFLSDLDYVYNQIYLEKKELKSAKSIPFEDRLKIKTIESKHSSDILLYGASIAITALFLIFKIAKEYYKVKKGYLETKKLDDEIEKLGIEKENASKLGRLLSERIRILEKKKVKITIRKDDEKIETSKYDNDFDHFWGRLTNQLKEGKEIRNWTRDSGYLGSGNFEAYYRGGNYIECVISPTRQPMRVPKKDFKLVFDNWDGYIAGRIPRHLFRDSSLFTKYTISTIHEFEHLIRGER